MFRPRLSLCCLLVLLSAGCKAQTAPNAASVAPGSPLNRKIEVLVRSQFEVPPTVEVQIGATTKSDFAGYSNLPITFVSKGRPTVVNFLLSNDGNTVARLEKFDISRDPTQTITLENRPVRGNPEAKVTVVNFDDLECPYCARMHEQLFPTTAERYKGLVRFVYKDYPLLEIHPWAMHAAIDANCLAAQSSPAYWSFVDYVHQHGEDISGAAHDPKQAAAALDHAVHDEGERSKLDLGKLDACTVKQDEAAVRASLKQGDSLGVNGTPTLFINGERISGAVPTPEVWVAIDRALREAGVQPPPEQVSTPGQPSPASPTAPPGAAPRVPAQPVPVPPAK